MSEARTMDAPAPVGPVTARERITAIDTLRGVAILGILVMNIYAFAMPFAAYTNPYAGGGQEWYNLATWIFTHLFFDQKFLSIFALLFGAGLVILWQRAEEKGASAGRIWYRRQFWLLVIGAVHGYLIWWGDILVSYALVGMVVFLFRKARPVTQIVVGCAFLPVALLLMAGFAAYIDDLSERAAAAESRVEAGESLDEEQSAAIEEWEQTRSFIDPSREDIQEEIDAYRGDYAGIVAHRAPLVAMFQVQSTLTFMLWRVGGLMLIGMGLMKLGVLSAQRDAGFYKRMMLVCYGLGLPVMIYSAITLFRHEFDGMFMFRTGMIPNYFGSILMALGHVALVMLIVKKGIASRLMARFSAVGRTALSNYLMHSIVMTTIFYGYGLGLYGEVPRAAQMLFVAAMIGLQLWLAPLWLERYRFGPAEWLWRSLTYWSIQPMRRTSPGKTASPA